MGIGGILAAQPDRLGDGSFGPPLPLGPGGEQDQRGNDGSGQCGEADQQAEGLQRAGVGRGGPALEGVEGH